ncbi:MAG: efflux transporter outer membrane subunit [Zoogloeaceae bacterium]|jgi:multidrug efflux system outer membrane protein|nr:efflux transporter outer membrane subunit [Zoogloeaceae bacterium]
MTKRLLPLLVATLAAGCAIGPDYERPKAVLPQDFGAEAAYAERGQAEINPQWWTLFGDDTLDALMQTALANNQDLLAAAARMEQAEAYAREAGADYFPTVDLGMSSSKQRTSGKTDPVMRSGGTYAYNDDRYAALSVNYEVDLWGKIRRQNESARAQALASRYAKDALQLSLEAQLASTYFSLRTLDGQLAATASIRDAWTENLKIIQNQMSFGAASAIDLSQARAALQAVQAQFLEVRRQRQLTEHLIGLLAGQPDLIVTPDDLDKLPNPPMPPLGLPSSLLEARPDVRQAEELLVSANANIGVAKAAWLPSISLTGLLGSESAALRHLFSSPAYIWSFGAALAMPIFDAGRTGARVDQATAAQKEAVATYLKTAQSAYTEVRDALVSLRELNDVEIALAAQMDNAQQVYTLAQARYEAGLDGFLQVLDALRTFNSAQMSYLTARQNHLSASVDLFRALGGGWSAQTGFEKPPAAESTPTPTPEATPAAG